MISFIETKDTDECLKMMIEFYSTDAVSKRISDQFMKNTIKSALSDSPLNNIIICKKDDDYAGYCHLAFTYSCEVGGIVALIEELYIRDSFKGKGLGTSVIDFIRSEYDSKVKRYRLEVTHDNLSAVKLYERLGFKAIPYKQMKLDI